MRSLQPIVLMLLCCRPVAGQQAQPFPPHEVPFEVYESGDWLFRSGQELRYSAPQTFWVTEGGRVDFRSGERVRINSNFRVQGLTGNGRFRAYIAPQPFEVKVMHPDVTDGHLGKYEKFEVGIRPPQHIVDRIQLFIDYSNDHTDTEALDMDIFPGTYQHEGWLTNGGINPFLEWEIKVTAEFVALDEYGNDAETKTVDGFYFVNCPRVHSSSGELTGWAPVLDEFPFRVRTALDRAGKWKCRYRIEVPDEPVLTTEWYLLNVVDEGHHGFVKVAANGRFRELDGETFFPFGNNEMTPFCNNSAPWSCGGNDSYAWGGAMEYPKGFQLYHEALIEKRALGMDYFRFIFNVEKLDIEFQRLGNYLGINYHLLDDGNVFPKDVANLRYSKQIYAAEFDRILDLIEEQNIFMHLVLQLGNEFKINGPYFTYLWDWEGHTVIVHDDGTQGRSHGAGNAYHAMIDGVEQPIDMLTNAEAWKYYKQRLRYQMSRWGYSTKIAQMDIQSEIDDFGAESFQLPGTLLSRYKPYSGRKWELDPVLGHVQVAPEPPLGGLIAQWQHQIADHIKNGLGHRDHLIGISYAGHHVYPTISSGETGVWQNPHGDWSFTSPHIDVLTMNYYEHGNSRPSIFHEMSRKVKKIQDNLLATIGHHKPILVTEAAGGGQPDYNKDCDNQIEWKRTVFASPFTGLAGSALNWDNQSFERLYLAENLGYMSQFMQQVDLVNDHWVAGASQGVGDVDHRAELLYLRNMGGTKAIGMISNRTANFFTLRNDVDVDFMGNVIYHNPVEGWEDDDSNCMRFVPTEGNGWKENGTDYHDAVIVEPSTHTELRITGLPSNASYELNFYNPLSLASLPGNPYHGPIVREAGADGELSIPYPALYPTSSPFLLVEVKLVGTDFLARLSGPVGHEEADRHAAYDDVNPSSVSERGQGQWSVYPNPAEQMLWITAPKGGEKLKFMLTDMVGHQLAFWEHISGSDPIRLQLPNVSTGVYMLKAWPGNGAVHHFKVMVK